MTDKAYEVIAKALEQFETQEFDSVAVVMIQKGGKAYFGHSAYNRLELMGALGILEAQVASPLMQLMQKQEQEAERESVNEH